MIITCHVNWHIGLIIWHVLISMKIDSVFPIMNNPRVTIFLFLSGVIEYFVPTLHHYVDSFHNHAVLGILEDHIDMHRTERSKLRLWEVYSSKRDWFRCSKTRLIICIYMPFCELKQKLYAQLCTSTKITAIFSLQAHCGMYSPSKELCIFFAAYLDNFLFGFLTSEWSFLC